MMLLLSGFTAQIGTQYSRPGNLKLGASTSVPASPTVNTTAASTSQTVKGNLSSSRIVNTPSATIAEINPRAVFFSVCESICVNTASLGTFVTTGTARTIILIANITTTLGSMFTSQLGTLQSRLGNIVLGLIPTQTLKATLNITATASATINGAAKIATQIISGSIPTVIQLFFDIEVLPGSTRGFGATIGAGAKIAFTYSLVIPIVIITGINAKALAVVTMLHEIAAVSKTISTSMESVVLMPKIAVLVSKVINASAAAVTRTITFAAQIAVMIKSVHGLVNVAVGSLIIFQSSIAASTASIVRTFTVVLTKTLPINITRSLVTVSVTMSLTRTLILNASRAAVNASVRGIFTISQTIAGSALIRLTFVIVGRALSVSFFIAVSAKVAVLSILKVPFSFVINLTRASLAIPMFSRMLNPILSISSAASIALTAATIKALIIQTISATRAAVFLIYARTLSLTLNLAATREAVTLIQTIKFTISAVINTTKGSLTFFFTRTLQVLINATAAHITPLLTPAMSVIKTIATTRASIANTFQYAAQLSKNIAATAASVVITSVPTRLINLAIRATTASVGLTATFSEHLIKTIAVSQANLVATFRAALSFSKTINASLASISMLLGRGIFAQLQIKALTGSVVLSYTIRALITATIGTIGELLHIAQQISMVLTEAIKSAAELIRSIVAAFQPHGHMKKSVIIVNPLQPNQITVAIGVIS